MRVYPDLPPDGEFQTLGAAGYDGVINDRQYKFLRDQGYVGSLSDMIYLWGNVSIPVGAIQQRDGGYILDRADNYIEVRT